MATNPTHEQLEQLIADSERLTGEVVMLNLLKFKARAESDGGGTGEESYRRYGEMAVRKVAERGGRVVFMGRPDSILIGSDVEGDWDAVALVAYPNRKAFLDMVSDPEYQKGHGDREGGLERMALIAMTPGQNTLAEDG
ncbi:MAG: DUF1330 domain-containing protein [Acidimicrobiia bacterium]|nr:DUF1330 domain-containing protein [Acidimicrobiia bacterium]